MTCPHCGHANSADLIECENCGEVIVDVFGASQASSTPISTPVEGGTSFVDPGLPTPTGLAVARLTADQIVPGVLVGGRYEILEQIGEGGMGYVYKIHDRELDKVIALKLIRSEQAGDPTTVQRFKQELLLARQVTHKNVVRIYDFGEADGLKFFTMEYIDGEDLKDVIRRRGKIPLEEALPWIRHMLEGLQEAHRQGVVHRDLKPQNIMIDPNGEAQLMDFGIARAADTNTMTATGAVMGTPDYLSPEQAYGEKADQQSDLYSFGVILFEMLTGELPFQAESPVSRVVVRLTKKPRRPRELNGELPPYLEKIILKLMELDKELRYESAEAVLEDLDKERVDRDIGKNVRRAVVRRKPVLVAAAVLAIIVVMIILWPPPPPPPPPVQATSLAILPFANATGSEELEWMRTGLPDMLFTDVSQSKYVRPVPGDRVARLLRELGVEGQARFDETTLEAVAERAPAQSVLYGQFVTSGSHVRLDLFLRRAGSGVAVPIKLETESSEVFELVDQITQQVKLQLDLTPEQLKGDTDRPVADVSTASVEALQSYAAGLDLVRQDANKKAIPLFEKAVAEDPNFAMAQAKLAEAYLNSGQYTKAEAVVEGAQGLMENADLPLADRYQIHAITALVSEDHETAVKSYRELVGMYPDDPDIQLGLAQSLEKQGEYLEAQEAYRRVLAIDAGSGAAVLGIGRSQTLNGQNLEAVEWLEGNYDTERFAGDLEAMGTYHQVMGRAYLNSGVLEKALTHSERSLDFFREAGNKQGQGKTLVGLGIVYRRQGQIDRAIQAQSEALALAREIGDRRAESYALYNLGRTYRITNLDKALESFQDSLRIERERQNTTQMAARLNQIALIYMMRFQYQDAIVYLEQAREYLKDSGNREEQAWNLNNIAAAKMYQGRYDEAIEVLFTVLPLFEEIESPRGVALVQANLAEIYLDQGRYADSQNALMSALKIYKELGNESDLVWPQIMWGQLLVELGKLQAADEELVATSALAEKVKANEMLPMVLYVRCDLSRLQGINEQMFRSCLSAVDEADKIGQRYHGIMARIALGRVELARTNFFKAEQTLIQARADASRFHLQIVEAKATTALTELYWEKGDTKKTYETAREAIQLAEAFSGRPLLLRSYATLGAACEKDDRAREALEAYTKVAEVLTWMEGNLPKEHAEAYMHSVEVQGKLRKTISALEEGGRSSSVATLRRRVRQDANKANQ